MPTSEPRILLRVRYEEAAEKYLGTLPFPRFIETVRQATQREITLSSLSLLRAKRSDVKVFNKLLVQYTVPGRKQAGRVLPDNFVVVHAGTILATTCYDLSLQPVRPLLVLEYVPKGAKRKYYEDNFRKYEKELKVPFCLLFAPEAKDLALYRHTGRKYVSVKPNEKGRYAIPELEIELAVVDGWVRYWYEGKLLPLPADLARQLEEAQRTAERETRLRKKAEERAEEAERRAEEAERVRRELEEQIAQLKAAQRSRPKPNGG